MKLRKLARIVLVCTLAAGCLNLSAAAEWTQTENSAHVEEWTLSAGESDSATLFGLGYIKMNVSPGTLAVADKAFSLEAGDDVTITCSYTPASASLDFGLLASDGSFCYVNVADGNIDQSLQVSKRGMYTLAVRNNSQDTVSVTGFVKN